MSPTRSRDPSVRVSSVDVRVMITLLLIVTNLPSDVIMSRPALITERKCKQRNPCTAGAASQAYANLHDARDVLCKGIVETKPLKRQIVIEIEPDAPASASECLEQGERLVELPESRSICSPIAPQ